jgi:hypothetical protein
MHSDEKGFKQGNRDGYNPERKQGYLWVLVTPLVTLFTIALSRAQTTPQAMIGKSFCGVLVSERYSSYNWVDSEQRQLCPTQLLRDFQAMAEHQGVSRAIGEAVNHLRAGFLAELETASKLPIGGKGKTPLAKTTRTCQQILKLEAALWTFVYYENIEPTNNPAERALRPAVILRKVRFSSQSAEGTRFIERMLTVNASLRVQRSLVLALLSNAVRVTRAGLPGPSLLPLVETDTLPTQSPPSLIPVYPL